MKINFNQYFFDSKDFLHFLIDYWAGQITSKKDFWQLEHSKHWKNWSLNKS